jgi:hypothetical protein
MTTNITNMDKKISHLLRQFDNKEKIDSLHFENLKDRIESVNTVIHKRIDMLVEDNFKIPDITIDPDIKPDSLRDYMTGNLFSLVRKLKKIE